MSKKKADTVVNKSKYVTAIPYVSQWDPDEDGRPYGLLTAIALMILNWYGKTWIMKGKNWVGLPGPSVFKDYLESLNIPSTLQHPKTCISCLPGDICLIDYGKLDRKTVQDKAFVGWSWCIYLGMTDKYVFIHDPNWSGEERDKGAMLQLSLEEWQGAFLPNTRGLSCIRLAYGGDGPAFEEVLQESVESAAIEPQHEDPPAPQPAQYPPSTTGLSSVDS